VDFTFDDAFKFDDGNNFLATITLTNPVTAGTYTEVGNVGFMRPGCSCQDRADRQQCLQ
jgi:hypothetical protein